MSAAFGSTEAQPRDGDIVFGDGGVLVSRLACFDPSTGRVRTLTTLESGTFAYDVRMGANNRDLRMTLVHVQSGRDSFVVDVAPTGATSTIAHRYRAPLAELELDFTGEWVVTQETVLLGLRGSTWRGIANRLPIMRHFGVAIDPDPSTPYYITTDFVYSSLVVPRIVGYDRRGARTTVFAGGPVRFNGATSIEHDGQTGDYLVCTQGMPTAYLVSNGGTSARPIGLGAGAARINLDGTAWLAFGGILQRVDLATGAVVQNVTLAASIGHLDVYGSRRIACEGSGAPGTSVRVRLASRRSDDALAPYRLAASFSRHLALDFGIGDRLNLTPDPLFYLSVSGRAPGIFRRFSGSTDVNGNATASIEIPPTLPAGLGLPIYVGGIITDHRGRVQTVTNVHWFVLS